MTRAGLDGLGLAIGPRLLFGTARAAEETPDPVLVVLFQRGGLHPALGSLAADYAAKRLAVIHAVGSNDTTRSHLDAQDFLETGTPGLKGTRDGWINRYLLSREGIGRRRSGPSRRRRRCRAR